jgi:hypothetical protein
MIVSRYQTCCSKICARQFYLLNQGGALTEDVENRMLRKIFGTKRDEVKGEWRKLLNKELHDLYSSPSIIRIIKLRMSWVGHVA